jgi:D-serine deaminase-like pyridoxal phosphate-dependent protein
MNYHFSGEDDITSPSLVYYENIIEENINKVIAQAGSVERLWPHMKSHKMAGLLRMQIERGITRFKCATIAEAEVCAIAGCAHVLVAYPLVGPNIGRFVKLREKYADTAFWAIGDNIEQLELLGEAVRASQKTPVDTLIDVNIGMNRTGVLPAKLEEFYLKAIKIEGLGVEGFHYYDGHMGISNIVERRAAVSSASGDFWEIKEKLEKQGHEIPVLVMGGSPSFPCHLQTAGVYLSPGTLFINDDDYSTKFTDLDYTPGAAILSRVVSHPSPGFFTLDTGHKAISTDKSYRGVIADLPDAKPVSQSEEHWVWETKGSLPPIGKVVYIIPAHICPTSALYHEALLVKNGKPAGYWEVCARNRKITV